MRRAQGQRMRRAQGRRMRRAQGRRMRRAQGQRMRRASSTHTPRPGSAHHPHIPGPPIVRARTSLAARALPDNEAPAAREHRRGHAREAWWRGRGIAYLGARQVRRLLAALARAPRASCCSTAVRARGSGGGICGPSPQQAIKRMRRPRQSGRSRWRKTNDRLRRIGLDTALSFAEVQSRARGARRISKAGSGSLETGNAGRVASDSVQLERSLRRHVRHAHARPAQQPGATRPGAYWRAARRQTDARRVHGGSAVWRARSARRATEMPGRAKRSRRAPRRVSGALRWQTGTRNTRSAPERPGPADVRATSVEPSYSRTRRKRRAPGTFAVGPAGAACNL
jgi:hypothetical protein